MAYPTPSPRIALSARVSPLLRLEDHVGLACAARMEGVDLDLTRVLARWRLPTRDPARLLTLPRVRSLWLPAAGGQRAAVERLITDAANRLGADRGLAQTVVVDMPDDDEVVARSRQLRLAIRLRDALPPSIRVAVAVRPLNPDGGRGHLGRLQAFRHQAAEWDIDFALDLLGPVDPRWEAEAAVLRLAPRIDLVRLPLPLKRVDGQPRARLARRVLVACLDAGCPATFSVAPSVAPWQWASFSALARACDEACEYLRSRAAASGGAALSADRRSIT